MSPGPLTTTTTTSETLSVKACEAARILWCGKNILDPDPDPDPSSFCMVTFDVTIILIKLLNLINIIFFKKINVNFNTVFLYRTGI
jgi:hypothetical protein